MELIDRQALLQKLFPYEVVDKKKCAINAYAVEKTILDMPNKADSEEIRKAVEYLENVLENWNGFCNGHQLFADAIEILVEALSCEGT